MARTRRSPAVALRPCAPATWLPPRAVVRADVSPDGAHCKLVVVLPDEGGGGEAVEVVQAVKGPDWSSIWLGLVAVAWSRHVEAAKAQVKARLDELQAAAEAREAASYGDPSRQVSILRGEGKR